MLPCAVAVSIFPGNVRSSAKNLRRRDDLALNGLLSCMGRNSCSHVRPNICGTAFAADGENTLDLQSLYGRAIRRDFAEVPHRGMAASHVPVWYSGLHFPPASDCRVPRRLLLAWLSASWARPQKQPEILVPKDRTQCSARSSCDRSAPALRMECCSHLGARAFAT